jgi:hypothetical protein
MPLDAAITPGGPTRSGAKWHGSEVERPVAHSRASGDQPSGQNYAIFGFIRVRGRGVLSGAYMAGVSRGEAAGDKADGVRR